MRFTLDSTDERAVLQALPQCTFERVCREIDRTLSTEGRQVSSNNQPLTTNHSVEEGDFHE